jgi:hypothetical protein
MGHQVWGNATANRVKHAARVANVPQGGLDFDQASRLGDHRQNFFEEQAEISRWPEINPGRYLT